MLGRVRVNRVDASIQPTRIHALRLNYCSHCGIKAPRSTGVKLLERYLDRRGIKPRLIIDYGCNNWRNSRYLAAKYDCETVRVDITSESRPDVVAYPTHMPFRDNAADVILFTHIIMFMNDKEEWPKTLKELARIAKTTVLEAYHVKGNEALKFENKEILQLLTTIFNIACRNVRNDMINIVLLKRS